MKRLNMKYIPLAVALAAYLPSYSFAVDVDTGLSVGAVGAIEKSEEIQKAQLFAKPSVSLNGESWTAEIKAVLTYNASDFLLPDGPNTDGYSSLGKPLKASSSTYAEIPEMWVQYQLSDDLGLKLGKQINNWGTLDEFRVLDVLNAQNFREFVFEDLSKTRLGIWGADAQVKVWGQLLEVFVSADRTVHESPDANSPFQFKSPEFRFGFGASQGQQIQSRQDSTDLQTYATRLKGKAGDLDYSAVYFDGPDYSPVGTLELSPVGRPVLVRSNPRKTLYGMSLGAPVGDLIARIEYGFSPNRSFNTLTPSRPLPRLSVREIDQHLLGIGVDRQFSGNLLLTAQWLLDKLEDNPANLVRKQFNHLASVGFRKPFLNEKLSVRGRWAFTESGKDGLVQLSGDYALDDSSNLRAGVDIALGENTGVFGQFNDRSRVKFEYEYFFQ